MKKLNIKKVILVGVVLAVVITGAYMGIQSLFSNSKSDNIVDEKPDKKEAKDNVFSELSYYHEEQLEAYQTYQKNNPDMSIEDIVTYVNMGIDAPFYSRDPIVIADPDALDVLVNKVYILPDDWEPSDLVTVDNGQQLQSVAAKAYEELQTACEEQGFTIKVHSGYRSVAYQKEIYENMISQYGEEYTDNYSSRPGQSEHNTGLCADISINGIHYTLIEDDANYETFKSLLVEYGFILRYPNGKENLTGYQYESWHIRYLGKDLAKKVNASGLTYDEYVARGKL
jgi:D-alanyl-D-alanine carboxypeptidase